MEHITFSIAEGKKRFSELIKIAENDGKEIIISRRGLPVAVILPYEKYKNDRKKRAAARIAELRREYGKHGLLATDIYHASRKELEQRHG